MMAALDRPAGTPGDPVRVPELSYFFPAHNEEGNLEPLVVEALATLPTLADRFEIVIVDDGSRDRTGRSPTAWRRTTRTLFAPSITRPTWATARRSGRASTPRGSGSSRSPTGTASSGSPTWAG